MAPKAPTPKKTPPKTVPVKWPHPAPKGPAPRPHNMPKTGGGKGK